MWDPYSEFESCVLPNGLTIYATQWPDRPWEMMNFIVHSGSEQDPVDYEGLSHYVEHLVSRNASSPHKAIVRFFRERGGHVALGKTSDFATSYDFWLRANQKDLSKALDMFGLMLMKARLESCLEDQRKVIQGEFDRSFPVRMKYEVWMRKNWAMYSGYWLERMLGPIGTPEGIARLDEIAAQAYYDTHYTPANMSVVCVGKLKLQDIAKLIQESPLGLTKAGTRNPIPPQVSRLRKPRKNRFVFQHSKFTSEPLRVWDYRTVTLLPGTLGIQPLMCLDRMMDKALTDEIRERRSWAYHVSAEYSHYRRFVEFSINCGAMSLGSLEQGENVILKCALSALRNRALFKTMKRRMLADVPMKDLNGNKVLSNVSGDLIYSGKLVSLSEVEKQIQGMEFEDISNLAKWFEPDRRWTLLTVP
ncbi:MAG: insulinase family protein [Patescibacteria group bacterium]